jgi:hypothetical protein
VLIVIVININKLLPGELLQSFKRYLIHLQIIGSFKFIEDIGQIIRILLGFLFSLGFYHIDQVRVHNSLDVIIDNLALICQDHVKVAATVEDIVPNLDFFLPFHEMVREGTIVPNVAIQGVYWIVLHLPFFRIFFEHLLE